MGGNIKYYKTKYTFGFVGFVIFFCKVNFSDNKNYVIEMWSHGIIENDTYPINHDFLTRCAEITKEEYESVYEL